MKICLIFSVIVFSACSSGESGNEGHVWQEQTEMIDRADNVEALLDAANEAQRRRIEEQTQ